MHPPPRRNVGRERPFGPSRAALSPEPGPVGGGVGPGSPAWPPLSDCFVLFCPNPRKLFVIYSHGGKADPFRRSLPPFAEPPRRILASCELCSFSTERWHFISWRMCKIISVPQPVHVPDVHPCFPKRPGLFIQLSILPSSLDFSSWQNMHPTVFLVELLFPQFWTSYFLCKHMSCTFSNL